MAFFPNVILPAWVTLAVAVSLGMTGQFGTPPDVAAQEQRPNCETFLDQEDAQVAFDADPSDPFSLDESGPGNNEACETEEAFGAAPLVGCNDLLGYATVAQALYEHALSKYGADRYSLSGCIVQGSTESGSSRDDDTGEDRQQDDPDPLDGDVPDTGGTTVVAMAVPLGTGAELEASLDERFAALEAQFAAFEARAENGFGAFEPTRVDQPSGGAATIVEVSASSTVPATTRTGANDAGATVTRAQTVRKAGARDRSTVHAQKARKDGKAVRSKEREGKRDRNTSRHRHRR